MLESPPAALSQLDSSLITSGPSLSPMLDKKAVSHLEQRSASHATAASGASHAMQARPKYATGAYPFPLLLSGSTTPELDGSQSSTAARAPSLAQSQQSTWSDSDTPTEASDSLPQSPEDDRQETMSTVTSLSSSRKSSDSTKQALQRKLEGIEHDMSKLEVSTTSPRGRPSKSSATSTTDDAEDELVPPTPDEEERSRSMHAGATPGAMPPLPMLPVRRGSSSQAFSEQQSAARRFSDSIENRPTPAIKSPPPTARNPLAMNFGMSSAR
ncbi:hypothetical protein ACM66B_001601 [Microbotryomycetes sp. NB124-2]